MDRGWVNKNILEVYFFALALKPWLPFLSEKHGGALSFENWDGQDDPPDIMAKFERGNVGFEVTRLLPAKIGKFNHIVTDSVKDSAICGPMLSTVPSKPKKMIEYALSDGFGAWASVEKETQLWCNEAWTKYLEKAERSQKSQIDYVVMMSFELFPSTLKIVADAIHHGMNRISDPTPLLILHSQPNDVEFDTWMIEKSSILYLQQKPEIDPADKDLSFEERLKKFFGQ